MTPLPWKQILSIFFVLFADAMTITMVFSFLPKLIKSFGTSEVDTGFKVGLVSASMFLGRMFFSLLWGYLADLYGKKKLLLISGFCLSTSTLAFGFSYNIEWLICTRLLQGMSTGIVVISKGIVTDMCDDSNASLGMLFIIAAYLSGLVFGPVVGGFLAFPGELYPNTFQKGWILSKFGVLLPNLLVTICLLIALSLVVAFISNDNTIDKSTIPSHKKMYLIQNENPDDTTCSNENLVTKIKNWEFKTSRYGRLLKNKTYRLICIQYALVMMYAIGLDESFPLYAATATEYNGLGFTTRHIGIVLMIVSCFAILFQFTVIHKLVMYFGLKKCLICSSLLSSLTIPLIPLCQQITQKYYFWAALMGLMLITWFPLCASVLCVNVMINNSVEKELIGSANGLGVAAATLGRLIAVLTLGRLYSWSLTNVKTVAENYTSRGFPFNQYFIFFVLSLLSAINAIQALFLPKSLDQKYKENTDT